MSGAYIPSQKSVNPFTDPSPGRLGIREEDAYRFLDRHSKIKGLGLPDWALLAALLLFYLALGAIFDTIAAMVLTLPVVYPLINGMGYDPIWWGVINSVVLELGMITPPFGINVFVLHGMRSDLPLGQIYRGIVPFLIADILRLGLLVSVPTLSLWLPRQLGWL